eukprot:185419_1
MHCEIKQSAQDTLIYQFDLNTISCSDFGQLCDAINSFEEIGIKRGSLIYLGPDQNGITLEKDVKLMEEYKQNIKQLVHEGDTHIIITYTQYIMDYMVYGESECNTPNENNLLYYVGIQFIISNLILHRCIKIIVNVLLIMSNNNSKLNELNSPLNEIAVVNINGKIVYQFSTDSSGSNDILSEQILHYMKNNTAINSINSFKSDLISGNFRHISTKCNESRSNLENEIKNICFDFKNNFEYAKTNYHSLNIYSADKHESNKETGDNKLDGYVYVISGNNNIDAGCNGLVGDKQIDNGSIEEAEDDIFNGNGSNKYNNNYNNIIYDIISAKNYDDNKGLMECTLNMKSNHLVCINKLLYTTTETPTLSYTTTSIPVY